MTWLVLGAVIGSFICLAGYGIYVEMDERRWRRYYEQNIRRKDVS